MPRNTEVLPLHQELNSAVCGIFVFAKLQFIVVEKKTTTNAELNTLKITAQFLHSVKSPLSGNR